MQNTITLNNNVLQMNLGGIKPRKYVVSLKYFDEENTSPTKQMDYATEIIITRNNTDFWLLDIYKKNIWFNQHEPDFINEMIADELCNTIYPLQVRMDETGACLGISNFNQIVNGRWYRNKAKATQKYTSKIMQSFYEAFEKNLENRRVFEKSMTNDWLWSLLFHPKYIDYGEEHTVQTFLFLPVVPYEHPIQFSGKQRIHTKITDYHGVEIHFESDEILAHPYFISTFKKKASILENKVYMRLNVYFHLDVYHLFTVHTRAYFEIYSKNADGMETHIQRIQFTQYQQETQNNKKTPLFFKSPFLVDENEAEDTEIYKTYQGKNYTRQEWIIFEEEQYRIYKEKKNKKGFWDFWK
ncbi:hypothetical protein [Flavobacterium covae]